MTNELVPVFPGSIQNQIVHLCDARALHSFLQVGRVFAAWIQARISKYGFQDNQDFIRTVSKTGIRSNVQQIDYHLTLDMAKELAMVENNDKGREVRRYFIECERRALQAVVLRQQETSESNWIRIVPPPLTEAQKNQAVAMVEAVARLNGVHQQTIWARVHVAFRTTTYTMISEWRFPELCVYLKMGAPEVSPIPPWYVDGKKDPRSADRTRQWLAEQIILRIA